MYAKLFCKTGPLAGAEFRIDQEATVGKSSENTIALDPSQISRKHARLFYDTKSGSYVIEDLKSRNGTRVDGVRVTGKQKLDKLNVITFASSFDFIFQVIEQDEPASRPAPPVKTVAPPPAKTQMGNEPLVVPELKKSDSPKAGSQTTYDDQPFEVPSFQEKKDVAPDRPGNKTVIGDDFVAPPSIPAPEQPKPSVQSPDKGSKTIFDDNIVPTPSIDSGKEQTTQKEIKATLWLEVEIGGKAKQSFELKEGENVVGRIPPADVLIEDGSISRKHAVITVKGGLATIKDLGSKNHTFFDNQRVNYEIELRTQTPITFGLVKAVLVRKGSTKE